MLNGTLIFCQYAGKKSIFTRREFLKTAGEEFSSFNISVASVRVFYVLNL